MKNGKILKPNVFYNTTANGGFPLISELHTALKAGSVH